MSMDDYTQITWPEVRAGDVLMHENGDRLTVTERASGVRVLVAGTEIGRMDEVWARHGFTPYRRKPEMPSVVVEKATGTRALPADFGNPRRTFTEWAVAQLCGADLRAKSPMHRELAEYLTVQKEKS